MDRLCSKISYDLEKEVVPIYEQWPIGCLLFHALGMSLSLLTGQPVEHRGTLFFHPSVHIPGYKGPLISLLCPHTSSIRPQTFPP